MKIFNEDRFLRTNGWRFFKENFFLRTNIRRFLKEDIFQEYANVNLLRRQLPTNMDFL